VRACREFVKPFKTSRSIFKHRKVVLPDPSNSSIFLPSKTFHTRSFNRTHGRYLPFLSPQHVTTVRALIVELQAQNFATRRELRDSTPHLQCEEGCAMMRRFIGRIWSSSQPTIKQEAEENEAPGMFDVYFWNALSAGICTRWIGILWNLANCGELQMRMKSTRQRAMLIWIWRI